jgi:L-ascorbate metabolism protein UlaG (beta-lactamase superfamily)
MLPRFPRLGRALAGFVLAGLARAGAAQGDSATAASAAPPSSGVEVTYLANSGFLLESGAHSILIDACLRDPVLPYAALPGHVLGKLTSARAPFDRPLLVLVSHDHADHVQPRVLERVLAANPASRLVSSPQVVAMLAANATDFEAIRAQVEPAEVVRGSLLTHEGDGLRIDFFKLDHGGKGHEQLAHLAHRIELGGLRLLHVGDAEPSPANFAPYHLDQRPLDVAFVPYWYFGSAGGVSVLREELRARILVPCHVPPHEWKNLAALLSESFPEAVLFREPLEKHRFEPAGTPPPSAAGPGPSTEGG